MTKKNLVFYGVAAVFAIIVLVDIVVEICNIVTRSWY